MARRCGCGCGESLPRDARGNTAYLNPAHRERAKRKRKKYELYELETGLPAGRVSPEVSADGRASARRGPLFEEFCEAGWPRRIADYEQGMVGGLSQVEVRELTGESQANVSRWYAAWLEDRVTARAREVWVRAPEIEALMVGTAAAFSAFRARYFTDEKGVAYRTPVPHERWIEALLWAVDHGGRQLILSPPRHGKTDLLTHFVVWMICRDPNIRVLWVGGNEDIATNAVGAVIDHLANNERMALELLGPGGSWRPPAKSGKQWTSKKMSVATRTVTGLKSATLTALGKGGKMLSLDADLIVGDDIVDFSSTLSPSSRKNDLDWFTQDLGSRKMEHTAQIGIGSRVHHFDMWGSLLTNVAWRSIVEHAHDPACDLPQHGPVPAEEHLECEVCAAHVDCMLFPEIRSMRWLQDTRAAAADDIRWEMIYQNVTRGDGADLVSLEDLRRARNPNRRLGELPTFDDGVAHELRLVGGIDPATRGYQAAFLWAYDMVSHRRYMLDLENRKAGGLAGVREIIRAWFERYGLQTWVIEAVGHQELLLQDRDVTDYCRANGIRLIPSFTNRWNKHDPDFGVLAQLGLFRKGLIDLPAGDAAGVDKVRLYEQQILGFEPEVAARARAPFDVVMAAWFPETSFQMFQAEGVRMVDVDRSGDGYVGVTVGDMFNTSVHLSPMLVGS